MSFAADGDQVSGPPVAGPNPVASALGATVEAPPSSPPRPVGIAGEPGASVWDGAGAGVAVFASCSASPAIFPSRKVGEALAEIDNGGGTVAALVGDDVVPAEPRPPGLGLVVGAEDSGSAPSESLRSVVVGEALAVPRSDGGTVAVPVGESVNPVKSRSPELGLGVGAWDRSPDGADEACPSKVSLPLAGAGDIAEDVCPRGVSASSVGDGDGARKGRCTGVKVASVGDGDGAGDDCSRGVKLSLVGGGDAAGAAVEGDADADDDVGPEVDGWDVSWGSDPL